MKNQLNEFFLANLSLRFNRYSIVSNKISHFLKLKNDIDIINTTISDESTNLNKYNFGKILHC